MSRWQVHGGRCGICGCRNTYMIPPKVIVNKLICLFCGSKALAPIFAGEVDTTELMGFYRECEALGRAMNYMEEGEE